MANAVEDRLADIERRMDKCGWADRRDAVFLLAQVRACRAALKTMRDAGCPRDTNGDGDCGKPMCPWCGKAVTAALAGQEAPRG